MIKILIIGKDSQIGFELQSVLKSLGKVYSFSKHELNILNKRQIERKLINILPNFILNLAAYTDVEKAEKENFKCYEVNTNALENLSKIAKKINSILIHFSTDYVFDGKKNTTYNEKDVTNPLNVYGMSKLKGDLNIINAGVKYLIFRTSWVSGVTGKNFVKNILEMAKNNISMQMISNQFSVPTSANFIAKTIEKILKQCMHNQDIFPFGIYNLCPDGKVTPYEFAKYILKIAEISDNTMTFKKNLIRPILLEDYKSKVLRPINSCLDNEKIKKTFKLKFPNWKKPTEDLIKEILN